METSLACEITIREKRDDATIVRIHASILFAQSDSACLGYEPQRSAVITIVTLRWEKGMM